MAASPVGKHDRREIARLVELMTKEGMGPKNGRFPKPIRQQFKKLPQIDELFQQMLAHPEFGGSDSELY